MNKKKRILGSVFLSMMSIGLVVTPTAYAEEEVPKYQMEQIVVEADKIQEETETDSKEHDEEYSGGQVARLTGLGILGKKDFMDTPFNTMSFTEESLENFKMSGQSLNNVLVNNPSVRDAGGGAYSDVSIRGFNVSGHSYYLNGISGLMCQATLPVNFAERIEVLSGPNVVLNSATSSQTVGGTINFISKKATDEPINRFALTFSGKSSLEEHIDIGRRFGKDGEYGIRVNADNIAGATSVDNEKLESRNLFVNLDRRTKKTNTNLLMGYRYVYQQGRQRDVSIGNKVTEIPKAPHGSTALSPDWGMMEHENFIVALNHEQRLNNTWSVFANAGYHKEDWYGYVSGTPSIINNVGDFNVSYVVSPMIIVRNTVALGTRGEFKTGAVKHNLVFSVDRVWNDYYLNYGESIPGSNQSSNIYHPIYTARPNIQAAEYGVPKNSYTMMSGIRIADTLSAFDDKLQVLLGMEYHKVDVTRYKNPTNVGSKDSKESSDALSPTVGILYKVAPKVSLYANYAESLQAGTFVGNSYQNSGEMLDPTKAAQTEIGVKWDQGNYALTVSAFDIKQANNISVNVSGQPKPYLRQDGEQENKGLEFTAFGKLGKRWKLLGGLMYLDAKQTKTKDGLLDGKNVNGAANWNANLSLEYAADEKWSFLGRAMYTGTATIQNERLTVPSWVRFDLGVKYKTKLGKTPMSINAMVWNVADNKNWQAKSGSSNLMLGSPRTFTLTATFDI